MENDNIKKLEELLNDGILSQEEFESKKAEVLNNENLEEDNISGEKPNDFEPSKEKSEKKSKNLIIGVLLISVAVVGYIFLYHSAYVYIIRYLPYLNVCILDYLKTFQVF